MVKLIVTLLFAMVFGWQTVSYAATTTVDSLIEKLVEKGILDKSEARELKAEIIEDEKTIRQESMKAELPKWLQDMKLKGDLRLRYQHEDRESTKSEDRYRIRYRLGIITNVNEKVEVGAGLATGSADPRSTNQTLQDTFQTPDIRLDYAYAKYTPIEQVAVTGGKFPKPFWNAKDLIFDSDIMFDGAAVNLKQKIDDTYSVFMNTGAFVLDNNQTENYDPFMWVAQAGMDIKPIKDVDLKAVGSYYGYNKIKDYNVLDNRSSGNTTYTAGSATRYTYDYDAFSVGGEVNFNNPFKSEYVPGLGLLGEFIKNNNTNEHDTGYIIGAWIGDKKVAGPMQWQWNYNFRRLERNAVLDAFPNSDFYGGATHVQGHQTGLTLGLAKNVSLDLTYFRTAPIGASANATKEDAIENLWQTDLNFKF